MQIFKKALPIIYLTAFSGFASTASAQYGAFIQYELNDSVNVINQPVLQATEASLEAITYNDSKSNLNYNYFIQPEIGPVITTIETSRVNATIQNSGVPYVSANAFARGYLSPTNYGFGNSANISSSMFYDLQINATPNTQIPITMTSYYEIKLKTSPDYYIGDPQFGNNLFGNSSTSGRVVLQASLNSQLGSQGVDFEANCSSTPSTATNSCNARTKTSGQAEPEKVIHRGVIDFDEGFIAHGSYKYVDQSFELTSELAGLTQPFNESFIKESILTNFLLDVGEDGLITGNVNIFAGAGSSARSEFNIAESFAYMDPYFVISPEYLAFHPNTIMSFTAGVGNDNPLAPVPEPETYAMFIAGLGLVGLMSRRRKNMQA